MEITYRNYWAVLPGEVAHDKSLTIAAKYLYVILSSMAHKNGFCWPENETLAQEVQLSKRRVVELLGMLRDAGYIRIVFRPEGKEERRYIYCGMFPDRIDTVPEDDAPKGCEISHGGGAEDSMPPCEKSHPPMREIRFPIEVEKQKEKQNENTPKATQGESGRKSKFDLAEDAKPLLRAYVGEDRELAQALGYMIEIRRELRAINSRRAIKMLLEELDRLSGGSRANKLALLRRAIANSWKTVYPMRPEELPEKIQPGAVSAQAEGGGGDCGFR